MASSRSIGAYIYYVKYRIHQKSTRAMDRLPRSSEPFMALLEPTSNARLHYILAVHIPVTGLALLPLLVGGPLLFWPIHIVFLELVIDPACAVVFEREARPQRRHARRPPRYPRQRLFGARMLASSVTDGAAALVAAALVYLFCWRAGFPDALVVRPPACSSLPLRYRSRLSPPSVLRRSFSSASGDSHSGLQDRQPHRRPDCDCAVWDRGGWLDFRIAENGDPLALTARPATDDDRVQAPLIRRFLCRSPGVLDCIELGLQRAQDMPIDDDLPTFSCRVRRPDFERNVGISAHAPEIGATH